MLHSVNILLLSNSSRFVDARYSCCAGRAYMLDTDRLFLAENNRVIKYDNGDRFRLLEVITYRD